MSIMSANNNSTESASFPGDFPIGTEKIPRSFLNHALSVFSKIELRRVVVLIRITSVLISATTEMQPRDPAGAIFLTSEGTFQIKHDWRANKLKIGVFPVLDGTFPVLGFLSLE